MKVVIKKYENERLLRDYDPYSFVLCNKVIQLVPKSWEISLWSVQ